MPIIILLSILLIFIIVVGIKSRIEGDYELATHAVGSVFALVFMILVTMEAFL